MKKYDKYENLEKSITSSRTIKPITQEEYQSIIMETVGENTKREILEKIISNSILEDKTSQEYASDIFKYLLNREGSYTKSEIDFITQYTVYLNYQRIKYDEQGNIRIGYEKMTMPEVIMVPVIPDAEKALGAHRYPVIYISENLSVNPWKDGNKDELFSYLQIISHEMVHYKQDFEAHNGILTESSFKSIAFTSIGNQFFDSKDNYRFREIEVEAQIESMKFTIELARQYFPEYLAFQEDMLLQLEDYMIEEVLSTQKDNESTSVLRDFYDIGGLSVAVATGVDKGNIHIDLLKLYPQLLVFFNKNKEIRSEEELLKGYLIALHSNNPIANIYEQFLVYIYHKDSIILNTNLSPELITAKKVFILNQITKELEIIEQIKNIENSKQKNIDRVTKWGDIDISKIIRQRQQRLTNYFRFLKSLQDQDITNKTALQKLNMIITEYNVITKTKEIDNMFRENEVKDISNIKGNKGNI